MSLHKHHTFLYISLPSLNDYNLKMPHISFCGGREHKATSCFFFLWILLEFNFSKNRQHLTNWTKWNKRSKVWSSATSLFKWRFRGRRHRCCLRSPPEEERYSTNVYTRRLGPRSNPSPFYIPFFTKKVPLWYTFYWKMVHLSHTFVRILHSFNCC